jgi:hypothetical protein
MSVSQTPPSALRLWTRLEVGQIAQDARVNKFLRLGSGRGDWQLGHVLRKKTVFGAVEAKVQAIKSRSQALEQLLNMEDHGRNAVVCLTDMILPKNLVASIESSTPGGRVTNDVRNWTFDARIAA